MIGSRPENEKPENKKLNSRFTSDFFILVFYKTQQLNPGFELFFSVNYCSLAQQPGTRVFKPGFQNPGFQFPVSNPN